MKLSPRGDGVKTGYEEIPPPIVECENCGLKDYSHKMMNFKLFIGSPGHESLPGIDCGANQGKDALGHWICPKEECFDTVVQGCKETHIKPMLDELHSLLGEQATWVRNVKPTD